MKAPQLKSARHTYFKRINFVIIINFVFIVIRFWKIHVPKKVICIRTSKTWVADHASRSLACLFHAEEIFLPCGRGEIGRLRHSRGSTLRMRGLSYYDAIAAAIIALLCQSNNNYASCNCGSLGCKKLASY